MIGARDMAFPRLNAVSLWLFFISAIVLIGSFGAEGGPANSGWTAYAPLSEDPTVPASARTCGSWACT